MQMSEHFYNLPNVSEPSQANIFKNCTNQKNSLQLDENGNYLEKAPSLNAVRMPQVLINRLSPKFIEQINICNINLKKMLRSKEFRTKRDVALMDYRKYLRIPFDENKARKRTPSLFCPDCSFSTNSPEYLLLHSAKHKNRCIYCRVELAQKVQLNEHIEKIHSRAYERVILFACYFCDQVLEQQDQFELHLREHEASRNQSFNFFTISNSNCFMCEICCFIFSSIESLHDHLMQRHTLYKCPFCPQKAHSFEALESHCSHTHSNLSHSFNCELCDYSCYTFGQLNEHSKLKHGIELIKNEIKCVFCAKTIFDSLNVWSHHAQHFDICIYKCDLCKQRFLSHKHLNAHCVAVHRIKAEPCEPELDQLKVLNEHVIRYIVSKRTKSFFQKDFVRNRPSQEETCYAIEHIL